MTFQPKFCGAASNLLGFATWHADESYDSEVPTLLFSQARML